VEHHVGLIADLLTDMGWEVREVGGSTAVSPWTRRLGLEARAMSRAAVAPLGGLDPDLVITNGFLGGGVGTKPRIHVYHGTMVAHVLCGEGDLPLHARYPRALGFGLAEWRAGGRGATTVAVSRQAAAEVKRYYGRKVDDVIELCVDTEAFRPLSRATARKRLGLDRDARYALYVGRTEHRKGSDMLLPVCERAGCELLVAGATAPDGSIHLGQMGHDELPWAYAAADAVLFPSRYEGFGFVSLEAAASERPLVATRTGWATTLAERVPPYSRYVVEPDVQPLAHALRQALERPSEVPVEAAAHYVRADLSLERFRERWGALIDSVTG
jgi:glycosyltransferase involved in cell wall biosynthesis